MERTEHSVLHYRTGYATIPVHFPNGQVCCDYCPGLNLHTQRIYKCMWLGGQAFASADAQFGVLPNCPITFKDDFEKGDEK